MSAVLRSNGRYTVHARIAAGGMASVHLGRMAGAAGFAKIVAIKRMHEHVAKDVELVSMFVDEARLAARLQHPNIVSTLDVISEAGELSLVMEYVAGESLSKLLAACRQRGERCPPSIAARIMSDALHGLHHAHEARDPRGEPLDLIHRDVSPQNILVGVDGVSRILDFGIAKVVGRSHRTRTGEIKGKLSYLAPELLELRPADRQSDIYAAAVVLWEALAGCRLFTGTMDLEICARILEGDVPPLRSVSDRLSRFDAVVSTGLERDRPRRYATCLELLLALEQCGPLASRTEVGAWVEACAKPALDERAAQVAAIEQIADTNDDTNVPGRPVVVVAPPPARRRRYGLRSTLIVLGLVLAVTPFVFMNRHVAGASAPPETSATSAKEAAARADAALEAPADSAAAASASVKESLTAKSSRGPTPIRSGHSQRAASTPCVWKRATDSDGRFHYVLPPECR